MPVQSALKVIIKTKHIKSMKSEVFEYIYIYNARDRLFGHLFATPSFMLLVKESSLFLDYIYIYLSEFKRTYPQKSMIFVNFT